MANSRRALRKPEMGDRLHEVSYLLDPTREAMVFACHASCEPLNPCMDGVSIYILNKYSISAFTMDSVLVLSMVIYAGWNGVFYSSQSNQFEFSLHSVISISTINV